MPPYLHSVVSGSISVPDLLDKHGLMRLLPAADLAAIPHDSLRLWCHQNARYGVPTIETVQWLREQIGGRRAIEIGSGAGDLAYHLGIPATDNRCQERSDVRAYYTALRQPVISYPSWVEPLDALDAIKRHQPAVVVGSWMTEWIDPDKPPPPGGGSIYGVRENDLLATGVTYILIGNVKTHGSKPILRNVDEVHDLPFLYSRTAYRGFDRIWIWRGKR